MTEIISISGLTYRFGTKMVLNNLSFKIKPEEIIGLFGRNGTGKSTLLNLLFGTLKIQSGSININNHRAAIDELRNHVAYSTQNVFLPPSLTVRNVIPLYFSNGEDQNKIFYAEGINSIERYKIGSLSVGEQKYLQFLLTVNLPKKIILLDEPFAMIDPLYREIIKAKIIEQSKNKAFVLTDHYYKDVFEVSTSCFILKEGTLKPIISVQDLKDKGYISRL